MTTGGARGTRPAPTLELVCDGNPVLVQAEDVVVGRTSTCTVRVVHPLVSREHCRIEPRADGLFVVDLGSVNGTWVNGARVESRTRVRAGDRVGLGRDGAVLVVQRAMVAGVDVAQLPRAEDGETLIAGDARAAGAVARVEVAADALPALDVSDEPSTRGIGDAPKLDELRASRIPVATVLTTHADLGSATPRPHSLAAPAPARRGFAPGFTAGLVIGLAVVAGLLKFTHALDGVRPAAREAKTR